MEKRIKVLSEYYKASNIALKLPNSPIALPGEGEFSTDRQALLKSHTTLIYGSISQ